MAVLKTGAEGAETGAEGREQFGTRARTTEGEGCRPVQGGVRDRENTEVSAGPHQ